MKEKQTKTETETIRLGFQFGNLLKPGSVVLLKGELASGKTTFAKGIGEALKIKETITSPSYTIMKSYHANNQDFYHFDFYRIDSEGMDFDFEDYINSCAITVIEWPFNVDSLLPKEYILVEIDIVGFEERNFKFSAVGNKYEKVINYVWKDYY